MVHVDLVLHGNPPYPIHPPNKLGDLLGGFDKNEKHSESIRYSVKHN